MSNIEEEQEEDEYRLNHKATIMPPWVASVGLQAMSGHFDDFSAADLCLQLSISCMRLEKEGDKQLKEILLTQVQILNAMFNKMLYQGRLEDDPKYYDVTMNLTLKAQKQCRTTNEALNKLLNPPPQPIFNQTNIESNSVSKYTNKFNFGIGASDGKKNMKNQLLEATNGEWMDPREASKTISYDPQMETLGAFYGPKDKGRETEGSYAWV